MRTTKSDTGTNSISRKILSLRRFICLGRLQKGAPNNKLILGIPAYGRAWKMDGDSSISGVPPLSIDGPAPEGPYSKEEGLLSYPEVCVKLANPQKLQTSAGKHLRKMGDPSKRKGNKI
jgi:chitinase